MVEEATREDERTAEALEQLQQRLQQQQRNKDDHAKWVKSSVKFQEEFGAKIYANVWHGTINLGYCLFRTSECEARWEHVSR